MNRQSLKIAGVYTAVILGAGFASGQEILIFFVKYQRKGLWGLLVSSVIFAIIGWAVLDLCFANKRKDFSSFMGYLIGKRLSFIMEIIVAVFLFVLFSAMLASSGAVFVEAFSLPYNNGVFLMAALCFVTFLFDLEGLVEINALLAPVLVAGGIFIGLYTFFNQAHPAFLHNITSLRNHWFSSAVIYSSYNIVTAVSVLTSLHTLIPNRKTACLGSVLGGFFMGLMGFCISLPLFIHFERVRLFEIPLLHVVEQYGPALEYFYILIFMTAVFTTALGNGFALIQWLCSRLPFPSISIKCGVVILGIIAAYAGFSNFVGKIYPMFGYVGLFLIILILIIFVREHICSASKPLMKRTATGRPHK